MAKKATQGKDPIVEARRQFLAKAGKFSIATPPAIAILLSEANRNYALAISGSGAPPGGGGGHRHRGRD
jgi:hypothetical protein